MRRYRYALMKFIFIFNLFNSISSPTLQSEGHLHIALLVFILELLEFALHFCELCRVDAAQLFGLL